MKTVQYKDISTLRKINDGHFSHVYEAEYNGKIYAFKMFSDYYPKEIMDNICNLTHKDFSDKYFIPLFIVLDNRFNILGYLMDYNKYLVGFNELDSNIDKVKLLKDCKSNLEILHKEYKLIHGDIDRTNLLFDLNRLKSFLIDFDVSTPIGKSIRHLNYIRRYIKDYIKKYGFNVGMDIYSFNMTTLRILYDWYYDEETLLGDIRYDNFTYLDVNSDAKRLCKELLLEDTRKKYSNEYIIDYIN